MSVSPSARLTTVLFFKPYLSHLDLYWVTRLGSRSASRRRAERSRHQRATIPKRRIEYHWKKYVFWEGVGRARSPAEARIGAIWLRANLANEVKAARQFRAPRNFPRRMRESREFGVREDLLNSPLFSAALRGSPR